MDGYCYKIKNFIYLLRIRVAKSLYFRSRRKNEEKYKNDQNQMVQPSLINCQVPSKLQNSGATAQRGSAL